VVISNNSIWGVISTNITGVDTRWADMFGRKKLLQFISSFGMFSDGTGGCFSYGAHIGGFIAGMQMTKLVAIRRKLATRPG